jgi:hypothetical protein
MKTKLTNTILVCGLSLILSLTYCYAEESNPSSQPNSLFPTETNDIIEVYNEINSKVPKFDKEFDTEQSYKDKALALNFPNQYIFNVEDFNAKYNPEDQILNVSLDYSFFTKRAVIKSIVTTDSYEGTNGLGARIKVHVTNKYRYGIKLTNGMKKGRKFKLSPEDAKILKENIKIIVFCNIKPSTVSPYFIFKEGYRLPPTFDHPYETNEYYYNVSVKVTRLLIFDKSNNSILMDETN